MKPLKELINWIFLPVAYQADSQIKALFSYNDFISKPFDFKIIFIAIKSINGYPMNLIFDFRYMKPRKHPQNVYIVRRFPDLGCSREATDPRRAEILGLYP